jgi:peptidoglycan/LPS O-acetylase OafA/YrhL
VWIGVAGLLLSGVISLQRMWRPYQLEEFGYVSRWAFAHVGLGAIGMVVGLLLTIGRAPPENPVRWMRLNLMLLLVAIFLGSATRHFQLSLAERPAGGRMRSADGWLSFEPTTQPSTQPTTGPATKPTTRPSP